jgi:hypothetical protein
MAFPPRSMTKNTRKGRTILKPRVPMKVINNKGKIELFSLCAIATIASSHRSMI